MNLTHVDCEIIDIVNNKAKPDNGFVNITEPLMKLHIPGYPRVGANRELKFALEAYWAGNLSRQALEDCGRSLRLNNWQAQIDAGLDFITVGDFAWYDHILSLSASLGVVPQRHAQGQAIDIDTLFRMGRGRAPSGDSTSALAMTKWFDTNYHYLVPELEAQQTFSLSYHQLQDEIKEAQALNHPIKVVLTGPVTYLSLCRGHEQRLDLLADLCAGYQQLLSAVAELGVEWVQLDEPSLCTELPLPWRQAYEQAYHRLQRPDLNLLVACYFGYLGENLSLLCNLPVQGVHIDGIRGQQDVDLVADRLGPNKILSLGLIDGRNVWAADLTAKAEWAASLQQRLGDRLWLSSNCSLLHVPVNLDAEVQLDESERARLAFAQQKLLELRDIRTLVCQPESRQAHDIRQSNQARKALAAKGRTLEAVQLRLQNLQSTDFQRQAPFAERGAIQAAELNLPLLPTTTIGSFPQTGDIRKIRSDWRQGKLSDDRYQQAMNHAIVDCVRKQDQAGLDVLVHGEFERNDMVEYFGEQIPGMLTTRFGWVQSYGSRCVKPPVIHGDVVWPGAMTSQWYQVAQAASSKWVKGMLTGPATMLNWSFVRDDIDRSLVCNQLALVIRDEVAALEQAGAKIIQIDEAALREGLPLRKADHEQYLTWAVQAFRLCSAGVANGTQIHTHMCYSHFNDIIAHIAKMDADVITIETSRNQMKLLDAFKDFNYPNEIGPGVWDIHSPNVPTKAHIVQLMELAMASIEVERLWINPDCGLKTRGWPEVEASLAVMVEAAHELRVKVQQPA